MSYPAISNLIVKSYVPTDHSCLRCISAYSGHDTECFGKHGCHFFDIAENEDEVIAELFDNCKVKVQVAGREDRFTSFMVCHRCFLLRQPCVAVPKDYVEKMTAINKNLRRICAHEDGTAIIPLKEGEEGYVQPQPASDGVPAVRAAFRAPTLGEKRDAVYKLAILSKSLIDKVAKTHHPQNVHCFLHSGAIEITDDPASELRPDIQSRSKNHVVAKTNANAKHLENLTAEAAKAFSTPSKKRKVGHFAFDKSVENEVATLEVQIEDCKQKIAADEAARAVASGQTKRGLTNNIKGHQKEIERLQGKIVDLRSQ